METARAGGEKKIEMENMHIAGQVIMAFLGKRLCWESKATLSQIEISSIQGWPGHRPAHRSFLSKRILRQRRGYVLFRNDQAAFLLATWRQIDWNQQLGSWLVERWYVKGPSGHFHHDGFSFWFFLFCFFLLQHVTCCSVSLCPSHSHALSLTHTCTQHTNHKCSWIGSH